jgi:hypothetical protein
MARRNRYREIQKRADVAWWEADITEKQRSTRLIEVAARMARNQQWRQEEAMGHSRLYGNSAVMGFGVGHYMRPTPRMGSRIGLNVTKSCTDSLAAKITKDHPKITFQTTGAEYETMQRAKTLETFVHGQFGELNLYEMGPGMVTDAGVWGTGWWLFDKYGQGSRQRIRCQRVYDWQLLFDEQESFRGNPPQIVWERFEDRERVIAEYAITIEEDDSIEVDEELASRIKLASAEREDEQNTNTETISDQVKLTEGWRLPSKPGMKDGRHTITCQDVLLVDEPWEKDHFDFVRFTLLAPQAGYRGTGLAEQLLNLQLEINVLMSKIQRGHHMMAAGHWLIHSSAKINQNKITNDFDTLRWTGGVEPKPITVEPLGASVYEHLERLYAKAYEISGISQLEASSQKPRGLNSGKALDTYLDITTERFAVTLRRYQHCYVRAAEIILELSQEIAEENEDFDVISKNEAGETTHVKYRDGELQKNEYVLELIPTNALADDPSERIAQAQAWAAAGWIDPVTAKRLVDFPDLQGANAQDLDLTAFNAVEKTLSNMVKTGDYHGPLEALNLPVAIRQAQLMLVRAWGENMPQDKQKLLRNWITDAQAMLAKARPPAPPAAAGPMPAVPGAPGGVPQQVPLPGVPPAPSMFGPPGQAQQAA